MARRSPKTVAAPLSRETAGGIHDSPPLTAEAFDYVARNRAAWERWALKARSSARDLWRDEELRWGLWGTPESELQLLGELEPGADVIELGCGTAAASAWLARREMRPVGVDFSRRQLETVERLQVEFALPFPLIHANAEQVPFDFSSFDVALSEYGASVWCDPGRWLREANRLLRPGGALVFFTSGATLITCTPADGGTAGSSLVRDYFSRYRLEFPGDDTVEFHLTHGDWVRVMRDNGFVLEDLIEVRPPEGAEPRLEFCSVEWARRWPSEEIWIARKLDI
jgi:SAM-dependent methyltransferase